MVEKLPLPPYYLYCTKHKQDMVEFRRKGVSVYRCTACVAAAFKKVEEECAAYRKNTLQRKA